MLFFEFRLTKKLWELIEKFIRIKYLNQFEIPYSHYFEKQYIVLNYVNKFNGTY